ncbi:hypothetical protein MY3296_003256 [Beauveria thailandica]
MGMQRVRFRPPFPGTKIFQMMQRVTQGMSSSTVWPPQKSMLLNTAIKVALEQGTVLTIIAKNESDNEV